MTESEWLSSLNPYPMLDPCRQIILEHPRKGRLFAVASCHRIWHQFADKRSRDAVDVAARYAEGLASEAELLSAAEAAKAAHARAFKTKGKLGAAAEWAAQFSASPNAWFAASRASNFAYVAAGDGLQPGPEHEAQSHLLRCIFGPLPFRSVAFDPAWKKPTVLSLAQAIYDERTFERLPLLADALEQAGCHDAQILDHCRQPGPHVRGCWVVDLVPGKE